MNGLKILALLHGRASFIGDKMIFQEGYVYHIKDEYFEKVQDKNLMQNKESGTYRPMSFNQENIINLEMYTNSSATMEYSNRTSFFTVFLEKVLYYIETYLIP